MILHFGQFILSAAFSRASFDSSINPFPSQKFAYCFGLFIFHCASKSIINHTGIEIHFTDNTGHTAVLFAHIIVMLSLGRFLIHQIIIR